MSFSIKKSLKFFFGFLTLVITLGGSIYFFTADSTQVDHMIPLGIFVTIIGCSTILTNALEIHDDHIAIRALIFKRKVFFTNIIQVDGFGDKSDALYYTRINQNRSSFFIIALYENRIQLEKELKKVLAKNNIIFT
ncbi:MAG: hypothetical protein RLZZ156_1586 [Deinococcota bacterium]|jgi:hypothetical protein